ncbi:protein kinase [Xanthoria parietina]
MSTIHSRLGSDSRASDSILLPYEMHLFADEGYLVEQYLDQGTLLDLVNTAKADSPSGVLDEPIAMFFTIELLRTVETLHSIGILHGDLKADNCLVRLHHSEDGDKTWDSSYHRNGDHGWSSKGLSLIDFGRGIDMTQFQPGNQIHRGLENDQGGLRRDAGDATLDLSGGLLGVRGRGAFAPVRKVHRGRGG